MAEHTQDELRALQAEDRMRKRRAALAQHLERHKFESWHRKSKVWVRDEKKIDAHHAAMLEEFHTQYPHTRD